MSTDSLSLLAASGSLELPEQSATGFRIVSPGLGTANKTPGNSVATNHIEEFKSGALTDHDGAMYRREPGIESFVTLGWAVSCK